MSTKTISTMPLNEALGLTTHNITDITLAALKVFTAEEWIAFDGVDRALALRDKGIPLPEKVSFADLAEQIDSALEKLGLKVELKVEATVEVVATPPPANRFAHLLGANPSSIGLDASALSPRIKPAFVRAAAQAVLAYAITGTGVLDVLAASSLWQDLMIEDLTLRDKIDTWLNKVESDEYITDESREALFNGVQKLFGKRFDQLMAQIAKMSAQMTSLSMMGPQAIVNVGDDASAFAGIGDKLLLLAEEVGTNMVATRMPEHGKRLISMVTDLFVILKDTTLHAHAGVVNASSPDEGAVMFLSKRLGPAVANKVRLALAYEALINALAECPEPMDQDYLKVVGLLAIRLNNLFEIVQPDQEVRESAAPFRRADQPVARAESRVGFRLNLSISWSRG